jgi:hypothetical protein
MGTVTKYPESLEPILERIDPTFGKVISCESGWWGLLEAIHREFESVDPDYRLYQIKEKFGSLKVYFAPSSPQFAEHLLEIAVRYERVSQLTCEVTGGAGQLMVKDGLYKTLSRSFMDEGWEAA